MDQRSPSGTPGATSGSAPGWFTRALSHAYTDRTVEVSGCAVHYLEWGHLGAPGIVLIHGGAAHAHWWTFIAPQLANLYHVVAIDLSGHGDSGWRDSYNHEQWATEILAVAADAGIDRPILVGHSMGGIAAMVTAALHGHDLAGAVIVDAPVRRVDPESEEGQRGRAFRHLGTYPDIGTAVDHFHLIPPQPCENSFILDYVAHRSLRPAKNGWTWKFDPLVFQRRAPLAIADYLARVRCRIAVLHGEFSAIVTDDVTDYMNELLGRNAPFVEIPDAHHHIPLDQPLALVAAVRAILADWQHSVPRVAPTGGPLRD